MDYRRLAELMGKIPVEATEIIIKGMETHEVFFNMPKEWDPKTAGLNGSCTPAPYPTLASKKYGGRRWRIA